MLIISSPPLTAVHNIHEFKKVSPPIMYILCLQLRKVIGLILSILLPLAELENKMVCTLEE